MTNLEPENWRTCFVAMPYGQRQVADKLIDFDAIYREIFRKAIRRVKVKNTVTLIPKRADEASHARLLVHSMYQSLTQSRLMLADLSTENTNVGAEIALRYSVVPTGTVLVRLKGTKIPFDFAAAQVTEYYNAPPDLIPTALSAIATALRETLKYNEIDNVYYEQARKLAVSMGTPENPTTLGTLLVDAELAARTGDLKTAVDKYAHAERIEPQLASLHQRRASLLIEGKFYEEAMSELQKALTINPGYREGERLLEQIKRGETPKPVFLDARSYLTVNTIIKADPNKADPKKAEPATVPEITMTPFWREDGRLETDLLLSATLTSKFDQIVNSVSSFGRVTDLGLVMVPEHNQTFERFLVTSGKSTTLDQPDQMLGAINTQTGIQGMKIEPGDFGGSKGGGGFGGGFL
jgi:tetratricopeptide (TPR) repeat protein